MCIVMAASFSNICTNGSLYLIIMSCCYDCLGILVTLYVFTDIAICILLCYNNL